MGEPSISLPLFRSFVCFVFRFHRAKLGWQTSIGINPIEDQGLNGEEIGPSSLFVGKANYVHHAEIDPSLGSLTTN